MVKCRLVKQRDILKHQGLQHRKTTVDQDLPDVLHQEELLPDVLLTGDHDLVHLEEGYHLEDLLGSLHIGDHQGDPLLEDILHQEGHLIHHLILQRNWNENVGDKTEKKCLEVVDVGLEVEIGKRDLKVRTGHVDIQGQGHVKGILKEGLDLVKENVIKKGNHLPEVENILMEKLNHCAFYSLFKAL